MSCIIVILEDNLLNDWCRMRMRPARLVSYAFLYTTIIAHIFASFVVRVCDVGFLKVMNH